MRCFGLPTLLLLSLWLAPAAVESAERPHAVFVIHEDEYGAEKTLPGIAKLLAERHGFRTTVLLGDDEQGIQGLEALGTADVMVLYARRKALPKAQLAQIRAYLDQGKPLVALRTASHAFALRNKKTPPGAAEWPSFDPDVLGGNYHGHGPNPSGTDVKPAAEAADHPILAGVQPLAWHSKGSLYFASPIDPKARVLLRGSADGKTEPVAWTRSYRGGRIFYTSLGHADDFQEPQFQRLLLNAIRWAAGVHVEGKGK